MKALLPAGQITGMCGKFTLQVEGIAKTSLSIHLFSALKSFTAEDWFQQFASER